MRGDIVAIQRERITRSSVKPLIEGSHDRRQIFA
jgi:hypothetical protein